MKPQTKTLAKRRRAFTLTELLAVMAILVVLSGLIIPLVGKVRANARSAQCLSNLRQIALGCIAYGADNNGQIPAPWSSGDPQSWKSRVQPYTDFATSVQLAQGFNCPEATQPKAGTGQSTYALNRFLRAAPVGGRFMLISAPPRTVLLADVSVGGNGSEETFPWNQASTTEAQRAEQHRHQGLRNVAMADGSARGLTRRDGGSFAGTYRRGSLWAPEGAGYSSVGFSPNPTTP